MKSLGIARFVEFVAYSHEEIIFFLSFFIYMFLTQAYQEKTRSGARPSKTFNKFNKSKIVKSGSSLAFNSIFNRLQHTLQTDKDKR